MDKPDIDLLNKIKKAALEQSVNLDDPQNGFTVWAEMSNGINYCGSAETHEAAKTLADEHINIERLYIVRADPPSIMPVENPPIKPF